MKYHRAWVSTGAAGAWHPPKFWTSPLAPADFEVLNTNWHPQSSFYVTSGTLSFKFLTQALDTLTLDKLGIELTLFPSRSCQSLSLKTLKNRWDLISWASLGPPPSLLAGSLTRSPSRRSRASLEMLTLRGNLTSSTNMLPENNSND